MSPARYDRDGSDLVSRSTAAQGIDPDVDAALKADVYAFVFGQKGLMAGLGLQGSKITKIGE